MISSAQKIRLGIFIVSSAVVFIIIFGILAGIKIVAKKDTYFVKYRDVSISGLDVGSQVKYSGFKVGSVQKVLFDKEDVKNIIITISIEHGTPIKTDAKAKISSTGITGLKFIEIEGGSNEAQTLQPESFIRPGLSDFDELTGKAKDISIKIELFLNNVNKILNEETRENVRGIVKNVKNITFQIDDWIVRATPVYEKMLDDSEDIMSNVKGSAQDLRATMGSIRNTTKYFNTALLSVNTLVTNVNTQIGKTVIKKILRDLDTVMLTAKKTIDHIDLTVMSSHVNILRALVYLRDGLENFNDFTKIIKETPSSLLIKTDRPERTGKK